MREGWIMKNNKQQNMHKQKLQIKENGLLPVKGVDNEKIAIYHVIVFYCNFFLSDPHCCTQYFSVYWKCSTHAFSLVLQILMNNSKLKWNEKKKEFFFGGNYFFFAENY